jgi:DNA replication protein DnaC
MAMTVPELSKALTSLRLSGMAATLEARALQVASHEMDFIEALGWLVQDELDRRQSLLLNRRFAHSGLPERKRLPDIDWSYNPKLPKRECLELATLKFIDARENVLLIGQPGTAKSHIAKALALLACERGYRVMYREAHELVGEVIEARELGESKKYRAQLAVTDLLVIDDLFLRRLPAGAGDEIADVLMSRYEKQSTIVTSNRPFDDWSKLLGDVVVVAPLLDRLMHHGHLLKFEGKSWRLKEAAARQVRNMAGEEHKRATAKAKATEAA